MKQKLKDPIVKEVHEIREKIYRDSKGNMQLVANIGKKIAEELKLKTAKGSSQKLKESA